MQPYIFSWPTYVNANVKSFLSLKAYKAPLIFVSLALSRTPVYTARPWNRAIALLGMPVYIPAFCWYSLHQPTEGWPG